ncbi:MAG: M1 family aminopeptidase [Cyclobacteriaceae bacterium]
MFKEIFLFELKYRLRRPGTWAYFGILLALGLFISIAGNGPASEKAFVNSPAAIARLLQIISFFGIMLASAVMGVPVYRDIEHKTENYFFSFPISEKGYILGRFFGSFVTLLFISLGMQIGLIIGFMIGPYAGFEDAERFTGLNLWHYIQPTLLLYWTNYLLAGCIFFSLVSMTKRIMLAYAGGAILFIIYLVSTTLTQDLESKELVSLLDPFGFGTLNIIVEYWTPEEQNTQTIPVTRLLIWNRIIWVGLGVLIFAYTVFRFDFNRFLEKKLKDSKKKNAEESTGKFSVLAKIPKVRKAFSPSLNFKLFIKLGLMEFKNILSDNFFRAIIVAAVAFLFFEMWFGNPTYGTPSLPLTYYMLEVKDATYIILVFVLIVFMTGEVLHRERTVNYDQIFGSLPVSNTVVYGSKVLALALLSFVLANMVLLSGVLNQVIQGYFNFELDMYFKDLYLIEFPRYLSMVLLAFFVHSIVTNKFLGHVIAIAIWLVFFGINGIADVDNNLFLYSYTPGYRVSDMNGFGHYAQSLFWFRFYWIACGGLLVAIGYLFWKRGTDTGFKARVSLAKSRLSGSVFVILALFLVSWIGSGFYINYNTKTLNGYIDSETSIKNRAEYEKQLSQYDQIAQPKITAVKVYADLVPEKRKTTIKSVLTMVNKSDEPIDSLHLNWGSRRFFHKKTNELTINGKAPELAREYKDFGYEIYKFDETLNPGDTATMILDVTGSYDGFPNEGSGSGLVYNGTFLNNNFFPTFGYSRSGELSSDQDRKKYDLPVKDYSLPAQDDKWGVSNLLFSDDADYITFEGVVSTAPDQVAIMPGTLQREWEENGRKYYHYKMRGELDFFYNISSARYDVYREVWSDEIGEEVNIEIFHHPTHTYNLDRFVKAVKHSIDYYSKNFGPYQYKQMRIIEFPRYSTFAQSFPNTVPFAESFGWVADFSDPNDLDYVYTVTAHEVAHQWWGHQITPSATRGANQISESMAEYSSLMVMKKEYGVEAMQKFLKEELDRYLRSRSGESKFEKTLLDNDNQSYVWYRKGGLVLYALQDLIGEDNLNSGFKAFIDSAKFRQNAPFATSHEWYGYIDSVTPDSLKYYIEDSFKNIVLYSNKVNNTTYKKLDNGQYEVTLDVNSDKMYFDGNGKLLRNGEQPNYLDIGVFGADEKNDNGMLVKKPLILEKRWVKPGSNRYTFVVDEFPSKAGIDPYNKMIDRIPADNLITVEESDD